ncbi:hypothetical protein P9112_009832 [Eukaryota sp. TZLM1-RC]
MPHLHDQPTSYLKSHYSKLDPINMSVTLGFLSVTICVIVLLKQLFSTPKRIIADEVSCRKLFICTGSPGAKLTDANPRIGLYTKDDKPRIVLMKNDKTVGMAVELDDDNCPSVSLMNNEGDVRAIVSLAEDDSLHIAAYDGAEGVPLYVQAGNEGSVLSLSGKNRGIDLIVNRDDPTISPVVDVYDGEDNRSLTV